MAAEEAERDLSYTSECESEEARKLLGSYYTPSDVARYFWKEFFSVNELAIQDDIPRYLSRHKFVEPSAGAGALFFALLEKLALFGIPPQTLASIDIDLVDINEDALNFIRGQISCLEERWGVTFENISLIHDDFRDWVPRKSPKPVVLFGNPPFVSNERGTSRWKNLFADFLEDSLRMAGPSGAIQFILPLSISFSRDYTVLRQMLRDRNCRIALSSFDNIPDTLFKSGKPKHDNTNKANSQRCTILTVAPADKLKILSTKLHRWAKAQRENLLSVSPTYFDVTGYAFDNQIPRPQNERILHYLELASDAPCLNDLVADDGTHCLFIAGVARNYIGVRDHTGNGTHELRFKTRRDFSKALHLISSDLFFDYWLSVGDGFHLTRSNIRNFPLHDALSKSLESRLTEARKIWAQRETYKKSKLNSGRELHSYDFSRAFSSLYLARIT